MLEFESLFYPNSIWRITCFHGFSSILLLKVFEMLNYESLIGALLDLNPVFSSTVNRCSMPVSLVTQLVTESIYICEAKEWRNLVWRSLMSWKKLHKLYCRVWYLKIRNQSTIWLTENSIISAGMDFSQLVLKIIS